MERLRVRDGVAAIERVREEDEPALLADRGQRVLEAHAARDLLPQEEPDHLALPFVLTSSPGMTMRSRPRASSTASSAPPKTLWSVTAIAPSPISSAASSSASAGTLQSCDHDVWVWRSQTIQSRSESGSLSTWIAAAGRARRR